MTCTETCAEGDVPAVRTEPDASAQHTSRTWVLPLACAAVAMANLDGAIVNIALPSMQSDFAMSTDTLQWVIVAFSLLLGGFLIVGGRLTDRLGRRRTFIGGIALMTIASLAAGLAHDQVHLLLARGAQGFSAALLIPAALSLVAVTFEDGPQRHRALAVFGSVGGIAGSFGVVVGGLLTAGPGWRWAFYINLPLGLLLIAAAIALLPPDVDRERRARVNLPSAIAVTAGLLLAVYSLHHATVDGWTTGPTPLLFAGSVVLLVAFARLETQSSAPLVSRDMWRRPNLRAANLVAFTSMAALLGFIYLGTLLMQNVLDYSPLQTGFAWLTTTVTVFGAAIVGGRLVGRFGVRAMLLTGLGFACLGAVLAMRVSPDTAYASGLMPSFFLAGVGFGLCGPAVQIAALSGVPDGDAGVAAGLVETLREIGAAAGVAAATTALVTGPGSGDFRSAFAVIAALAVVGGCVALVGLADPGGRP